MHDDAWSVTDAARTSCNSKSCTNRAPGRPPQEIAQQRRRERQRQGHHDDHHNTPSDAKADDSDPIQEATKSSGAMEEQQPRIQSEERGRGSAKARKVRTHPLAHLQAIWWTSARQKQRTINKRKSPFVDPYSVLVNKFYRKWNVYNTVSSRSNLVAYQHLWSLRLRIKYL